ncbi:MAG: AI-2E family transporter, partial [Burkholderiaceae bacterium]|nr:AI-2E family transporter [Burkholderiaceae bacterium]
LGERIGLHPIAVIFALLAFGHLFGFVGILVALPVSAVLLVALRRLMEAYSSSDLYAGDGLRKVAPSVPERLGADRAAPAAPAAFTAAEGPPAP